MNSPCDKSENQIFYAQLRLLWPIIFAYKKMDVYVSSVTGGMGVIFMSKKFILLGGP